jgi:hypothetical protein
VGARPPLLTSLTMGVRGAQTVFLQEIDAELTARGGRVEAARAAKQSVEADVARLRQEHAALLAERERLVVEDAHRDRSLDTQLAWCVCCFDGTAEPHCADGRGRGRAGQVRRDDGDCAGAGGLGGARRGAAPHRGHARKVASNAVHAHPGARHRHRHRLHGPWPRPAESSSGATRQGANAPLPHPQVDDANANVRELLQHLCPTDDPASLLQALQQRLSSTAT